MGENNNNGLEPESARRRDGNIDFSRSTTDQLDELRDTLDPAANPLNHAALLAELEKRSTASPSRPRWTGRFSRRSGLAGWISARLRNSPLAFAAFLPVKSVGVMGDGRRHEPVIALRAVQTVDFMTAHWAPLPYQLLDVCSRRIVNEVKGVSRVVYDISGKPPATIERE